MKEIVNRLQENRQIELAKSILESHGYNVYRLDESISSSEKEEILSIFRKSNQHVIDSREEEDDGITVFIVECDNSNPTHIAYLQRSLDKLESKEIGYDRESNGHGFYGRNYIFYKYDDIDDSED